MPTPHSWLTPKARLGPSPLGGQGLLAVAPIPRHELVAIWANRIMTTAQMWALPVELQDFPVQVWYDMFVGPMAADEVEPVDYMNHGCAPNCGVRGSVVVVARRDVSPGEELTFDYGTTDTDRWTLQCQCGAPTCRGRMTGDDWQDPAFQAANTGYLSLYVQELIAHQARGTPLVGLPPDWHPATLLSRHTADPPGAIPEKLASSAPEPPAGSDSVLSTQYSVLATARRGGRPGRRPGPPDRLR
jgi:uncharacterized protein